MLGKATTLNSLHICLAISQVLTSELESFVSEKELITDVGPSKQ